MKAVGVNENGGSGGELFNKKSPAAEKVKPDSSPPWGSCALHQGNVKVFSPYAI